VIKPNTYQLGIVGEAGYQAEIRACSPGDCVQVLREPDNPYDKHALAVVTVAGQVIGYVPRSSWLQDAIHEEGKGCDAVIRSIKTASKGLLGVVLDVSLTREPIGVRNFNRSITENNAEAEQSKSWLARFLGG